MHESKTNTQKRLGVRLKFQFGDEKLNYAWADRSGERQYSVAYEAIVVPDAATLKVNNRSRYRRFAIYPFLAVGIGLWQSQAQFDGLIIGGIMAGIIAIAVEVARGLGWLSITYTMLPMRPVPAGADNHKKIRIIHDRQHDAILGEITSRWKARLKELHGVINFENDVGKEIAKFNWLKKHDVISEVECRGAIEKLQAYAVQLQPKVELSQLN